MSEETLPVVAALCLAPADDENDDTMTLTMADRDDGPTTQSHVFDFLRFLMSDRLVQASRGERLSWEWSRA